LSPNSLINWIYQRNRPSDIPNGGRRAPCVVAVFHYEAAGGVEDGYNVALQVLDVGVFYAVIGHGCGLAGCVVGEVIRIRILFHRYNVLALQDVIGGFGDGAVYLLYLSGSEAIMVILVFHRHAGCGIVHGFQLSAFFPSVRPLGIACEITDGVVRKLVVAEVGELVLPVCVRIAVD